MVDIDDVVQATERLIPKAVLKRIQPASVDATPLAVELCADLECREPKCLDFDRLADPRRDDPVADSGVHPRQLLAGNAGAQQAVGVTTNPVAGAAKVPRQDRLHGRRSSWTMSPGSGGTLLFATLKKIADGDDVPQRRVDGIIFRRRAWSGNRLGSMPSEIVAAHAARISAASFILPPARHRPRRAINVSRPQSANQG